jgi:hypothetical protein
MEQRLSMKASWHSKLQGLPIWSNAEVDTAHRATRRRSEHWTLMAVDNQSISVVLIRFK